MDEIGFTRRSFVNFGMLAAGGLATLGCTQANAAPLIGSAPPVSNGYDPRKSSAGLIKLEAYADGRPAPWWYIGTIYAVRERQNPVALFKFEGCEVYQAEPLPGGDAICNTRTLTFFRDLETNEWIDEFANPFTGKRNPIRPNILGGQVYFPADGSPPRARSESGPSELAPQGSGPVDPNRPTGDYDWIVAGDMVLRLGYRGGAAVMQPAMECQSTMGDAAAFFDPKVTEMGARFSSATFSPYLGWMEMPDEPGHLVWHAAGLKLSGYDALPAEYARRAEERKPGLLTAPFA